MARTRLKVFRAQMGFADTVVAAPSRRAALEAWGARQDLFGEGLAREETADAAAIEAALARPGEVLRRAAGSSDAFGLQAAVPAPPAARKPVEKRRSAPAKPPPPTPPPPPDRSELDAAEAALRALDTEAGEARAELERRRAALDAEGRALERDQTRARKAVMAARDAAERRYRSAGGR